jgi:hopene-associated glycosyltransferase HpnB
MTAASLILAALAVLTLVIWLVLFFARGDFWKIWTYDANRETTESLSVWPSVTAIVPARNEVSTVGETVTSLARQEYPGEFSILIVDDHSVDGTSDAVRQAASDSGASSRVEVIPAPPLPSGWTGKVWAMNAGVEAASSRATELFWFVDADVAAAPDVLRNLVSRLQSEKLALASLMVFLKAETLAERLLMPPFLYFFLMLYPPRWIADPKARTAGAAGGCILLRREILERIGGFASIHGEVIDDCTLARAVKRSGGRVWLGLTRTTRTVRGYGTFSVIRDMIARTAFTQLGYSTLRLLGTLAALAVTYFLPVVLTFSHDAHVWPIALLAWILMCASFVPTLAFYGLSPLFAPFLPLVALFYAYATALSAVRYWLGRGGQWKGRAQAQPPGARERPVHN